MSKVKFYKGTQAKYNALTSKDSNGIYICTDSKNGYIGNIQLWVGDAGEVDWESITGKPTTFSPSAHNHTVANITDFPTIPAAQVSADWNATTGVAQILNKPTIPAAAGTLQSNLDTAQTASASEALTGAIKLHKISKTGSYNDLLNKPTIPATQVNADWNATTGVAQILNKPTIPAAQVSADWNATTGVAQILNKPTIPETAGTLQSNLTTAQTASASEALTGAIKLHKISKTGSYNDLLNKPTYTGSSQYTITTNQITIANFGLLPNSLSGKILILNQQIQNCKYIWNNFMQPDIGDKIIYILELSTTQTAKLNFSSYFRIDTNITLNANSEIELSQGINIIIGHIYGQKCYISIEKYNNL
jgi:hypothetical protein